jgi:plastocyanin
VATALSVVGLVAVVAGLTSLLAGRAAYIHVGGLLATCMAGNVWMRIIPGQRRMLAEIAAGREPDPDFTRRTQARSIHNGYLQFPVIFVMISNHYPTTYGHPHNAIVLLLIMVVGACARQILFDAGRSHPAVFGTTFASVVPLFLLTAPLEFRPPPPPPVAGSQPIDPTSTGRIVGTVHLDGTPPPPKQLVLTGCTTSGPVFDDSVVAADGRLANTFVWVREGAEPWAVPPPPTTEVVVDQVGCMYTPKVIGVRAGQPVTFVNDDPVIHNVRTVASVNKPTNDVMTTLAERLTHTFSRPEVMIEARCDVHPWMVAQVGVVAHPWFAVSGADGSFVLEGVPAGRYVVEAVHQVYGRKTAEVVVAAKQDASAEFRFRGP